MAIVYVEPRPKGRPVGAPIDDYVVEGAGDVVLHTSDSQAEAINWARSSGHTPNIARVRHLSNKSIPGHWRNA
ncbi:MAG: hypothetical protein ABSD80_09400 [Caulobacteraceae bacterium]|jgi:hypothetical protein